MKKFGFVGLTAMVFCALVFVALHMIFLNSQRQFYHKGALIGAESFTHSFRIPNYSWRTLEVGNVTSSCGCTVVGNLPKSIPPFRNLNVPVKINLTGRSGAFKSNVTVALKPYGVAEFAISADIYPMLPKVIDLGKVRKDASIVGMYAIPSDLSEKLGEAFSDTVTAQLETIEGQPIVKLTAKAPLVGGDFEIQVTRGADPTVFIGYVQQDIEAQLSTVSMGNLRPGSGEETTATGVVRFFSPYDRSFKWRPDLTQHSEWVALEDAPADNGLALRIQLKAPPSSGVYREVVDFGFEVAGSPDLIQVPIEIYAYILDRPL